MFATSFDLGATMDPLVTAISLRVIAFVIGAALTSSLAIVTVRKTPKDA